MTARCLPRSVSLLALALAPFLVHAQQLEQDYSKYARPFWFVLPERSAAEKSPASVRKYVVQVDINADGSVKTPVDVEPAEPAMVDAVNAAARLWVFYPELTRDCKPGPRRGRVGIEYDGDEKKYWLEIPALEGVSDNVQKLARVVNPGLAKYPRSELMQGIEGRVTIAVKLLPDGSTAEQVVYLSTPRTKGLAMAALQHARGISVELNKPLERPFACALIPYWFQIE